LYHSALSLLLDQGDSQGASQLFQRYIDTHPDGRRLPNALYWQGEALILLADYAGARDMFERVLRDFPQDLKAAGAMLKLGVVYGHLGNRAQAEQTWRDLPLRYPDSSSEIGLARDYLGQQR
ncbi:MAG TPA: tol-pal system protein YbgF, partial [Pseudomonadaceae bacterium]|nr:tol-pal system protein YbgF [Pseudomonadaceae bacterium]